jgi:hypothetical protein
MAAYSHAIKAVIVAQGKTFSEQISAVFWKYGALSQQHERCSHSAKNMPALKTKSLNFQQVINSGYAESCEIVHNGAIPGQNRLNLDKSFDQPKGCSMALTSE